MIVLASKSPRRKAYLELLSLPYVAVSKNVDESIRPGTEPEEVVKELSYKKAKTVQEEFQKEDLIIGGDTLVYARGEILGKPKDEEDARRMLLLLSGKTHEVFSGITVLKGEKAVTKAISTKVTFKMLTTEEIEGYIRSGEPFDKAGSYGIQGKGGLFVTKIEGDYSSVVGLPMPTLYEILHSEFGVKIL